MSNEVTPSRNSTVPMGAGAQVLQKTGVLGAKAMAEGIVSLGCPRGSVP